MCETTMKSECIDEKYFWRKRNTFGFYHFPAAAEKTGCCAWHLQCSAPTQGMKCDLPKQVMTGLMILGKIYSVYDSPDHHISSIRTLLSHARNLQAVPVPQVSLGILIKTNTSETHKHKRNTQTQRKRSRRTFYIPPRLDPFLSCPRTPATLSTSTWPGCTSEQY